MPKVNLNIIEGKEINIKHKWICMVWIHLQYCKMITYMCNRAEVRMLVSYNCNLPASPKAKAGLGVQSLRPSVRLSVCPSVRPKILSSQLLWNYWSDFLETWYVDRTSYVVMHIGRKFWSPHFCGSYALWNLENTHKWPCHRNSSETTDPIFMKLGM